MKRGGRLRPSPIKPMSDKRLARLGGWAASTFAPKPRAASRPARPSRFLKGPAAVIEERSGRICEIQLPGLCVGRATDKSHRVGQKRGGRHGAAKARSDRPSNALDACRPCHHEVTHRPTWAKEFGHGWALEEWQEPRQYPVLYRGGLVYLDDLGGKHSFEKAGA